LRLASELRLMCVLAHPDDESLGTGGALAQCAAEGVATYLVTATRGERGRFGDSKESPGPEIVGKAREAELLAAAKELGIREVSFLDYLDGALDQVDAAEATEKIAGHIRRVKPQVVITFGPDGAYGHPDHIAISQLTTAAIVGAADPSFGPRPTIGEPHRVSKLYFIAWSPKKWAAYQTALRKLVSKVDGAERQARSRGSSCGTVPNRPASPRRPSARPGPIEKPRSDRRVTPQRHAPLPRSP